MCGWSDSCDLHHGNLSITYKRIVVHEGVQLSGSLTSPLGTLLLGFQHRILLSLPHVSSNSGSSAHQATDNTPLYNIGIIHTLDDSAFPGIFLCQVMKKISAFSHGYEEFPVLEMTVIQVRSLYDYRWTSV